MSVSYVEKVFEIAVSDKQANLAATQKKPAPIFGGVRRVLGLVGRIWNRTATAAEAEVGTDEIPAIPKLLKRDEMPVAGQHGLQCIVGLMGETRPDLLPVSPAYGSDAEHRLYRFDWIFGIAALPRHYWDWQSALRDREAVVVQLLIAPGASGYSFTELSTDLTALHPSKDTRSWLETHREQLGKALADTATLTSSAALAGPPGVAIAGTMGAVLRTASVLTNFVNSDDGNIKNWYIYRFLDGEERCYAVEWKVNKRVLLEYGPLLRGSLLLAFHGTPSDGGTEAGIRMTVRANLGFWPHPLLRHVRATLALENGDRPSLLIRPQEVQPHTM